MVAVLVGSPTEWGFERVQFSQGGGTAWWQEGWLCERRGRNGRRSRPKRSPGHLNGRSGRDKV